MFFSSFALIFSALIVIVASDCTCLPGADCPFVPYGRKPLDIRDFGVLALCPVNGEVLCCDRSRKFAHDLFRIGMPKSGGSVECSAASECRIKYGISVYDIQQYGVLGHCQDAGQVRYDYI
jgi:hypothetical protein